MFSYNKTFKDCVCLFVSIATMYGHIYHVYYYNIQWNKLYLPQVWLEAATQIFFSLGISTGGIIALSSYSTSVNTALRDSIFVCIVNSATSLFSSITIFSILGYKARETGDPINEVKVLTSAVDN